MRNIKPWLVAATLAAGGCAGMPADEMSAARASIGAAVTTQTKAGELARAETKLALAQRWIDARDYAPARWLAEQAQIDAELAAAKAATEETLRAVALNAEAQAAYRKAAFKH